MVHVHEPCPGEMQLLVHVLQRMQVFKREDPHATGGGDLPRLAVVAVASTSAGLLNVGQFSSQPWPHGTQSLAGIRHASTTTVCRRSFKRKIRQM
ncbi:uncharacterized protein PITG_12038 [Phytophthora infestans T30-4]|uniref:Uncharacterized protein n=1 Tax=Phytophthora infestans (strain T30-4) TaxID=403677 RepID=D0NHS2_PHYIT|nr:uncharacterized protein PITG_12038 [Phytophthora infestans T30-4]EEY58997.1 hypothetical protein PITG_12038 [Phytophthora infestans T30-4]|eukprot:XP_002901470.1 hypothetical protein PITG_12038 [Phytophthora infestans T30-4]